jgi:catechol 2,3-dioxygenase-like lactoylglutathione lyase family enzyme
MRSSSLYISACRFRISSTSWSPRTTSTPPATGAIDHIAFRATGLRATLEHLKKEKIQFSQRQANGQALIQLFFYDPNGIKIELNFDGGEAGDS